MRWALVMVVLSGCLQSGVVPCGDGRVCPEGTMCVEAINACVVPEQLMKCAVDADGTDCTYGTTAGICNQGVCVKRGCGDGFKRDSEACDGEDLGTFTDCIKAGFYENGTVSCTPQCTLDVDDCRRTCNDGVLDEDHEQCDGALLNGNTNCTDLGYYNSQPVTCSPTCLYNTTMCSGYCGDGTRDPEEICDGSWSAGTCLDFGFDAGRMDCTGACAPDFAACAQVGWRGVGGFTSSLIDYVWGVSSTDVWAIQDDSTDINAVYHYDGDQWRSVATPTTNFHAVWGATGNDVWAITDTGVSHWNGTAWAAPITLTGTPRAIWGAAANDIWVLGDAGMISHYTGTWNTVVPPSAGPTYTAISGTSATDIWAVGTNGTVIHYNGAWSTPVAVGAGTATLFDVYAIAPNNVWVAGASGLLLHYTGTWAPAVSGTAADLAEIWGSGPLDVWASGAQGTLLHYNGVAWVPVLSGTNVTLGTGFSTGPDDHWVAGPSGTILRSQNTTWSTFTPSTAQFNRVWMAPGGADGWAVAANLQVRWDGRTWTDIGGDPTTTMSGVWGLSSTAVWEVGYVRNIRMWNGASWTDESVTTTDPFASFRDVWGTSLSDVWAVGTSGTIVHRTPTWAQVTSPTVLDLFGVDGTSATDVWAVGRDGTLLHYDGTWTARASGTTNWLYAVEALAANDVWFCGQSGTMLHYTGGSTFAKVPLPVTVDLRDMFAIAPDDIWAVGDAATVLHWDGVSWTRVRTAPGAAGNYLSVYGDSRAIMITGSIATITRLERVVPWICHATETACADRTDDDCDGEIDAQDSDCP